MTEKDFVLCEDIKHKISKRFIENGWITVSGAGIHSALINDENISSSLDSYRWDLKRENGKPYTSTKWIHGQEIVTYIKTDNSKCEPLVHYRYGSATFNDYVELTEEFRLYHRLHEEYVSQEEKKYFILDEDGDKEYIAHITGIKMLIKAKYMKSYLSIRKINLLIFFDIDTKNPLSHFRFGAPPITNQQITKNTNYIYADYFGQIWGKCLLRYDLVSSTDNDNYCEYIIGYDDSGEELSHTCNNENLSNYFVQKDDQPLETTLVYFKADVLNKYHSDSSKYSVEDGCIQCNNAWSLRVDNSTKDYIVVMLVYLGHLNYSEQLYWKSFNIAPPVNAGLSYTAHQRWMEGNYCSPDSPDLFFKELYTSFSEKWHAKYNWNLFIPLIKADEHRFKTLHRLTTPGNEQDFEEQILSLVKIFIDSLNEKELIRNIDSSSSEVVGYLKKKGKKNISELKGIGKLELFILVHGYSVVPMFDFLSKLQALRSYDVAHRKSSDPKKRKAIVDFFNLENMSKQDVLDNIFTNCIKTLNQLGKLFLKENKK